MSEPTDLRAGDAAHSVDPAVLDELLSMRASIDNIDATLVYLLAERFKATQRVGVLKAEHQLPPADPARERNQIQRLKSLAADAELDPEFAEKFLNFIIEEVIRHHQAISASSGTAPGAPHARPADTGDAGPCAEESSAKNNAP